MEKYNLDPQNVDELDNKTDSAYDPNKPLSPEDIAKLFAAQAEPEATVEAVLEMAEEVAEAVEAAVPEPTAVVEVEPEPDPNKPLSPEDIAKLFAAQAEPEAAVEAAVPEPAAVVEAEPELDPNKPLSPEDIAKLFAAQDRPESAVEVAAPEPAAVVEAEPVHDSNKPLSPEDIAKLFAAQDEPETAVEAVPETADADAPESAAAVEAEPELDPNKPLSPEDIAKLFAAQDEPEAAVEAAVPEPAAVVEADPAPDPNKPLSPEDIAKLFAAQAEPEAAVEAVPEMAEEVIEIVEAVETAVPEPATVVEVEAEPEPDPNKPLSPEDIAKLFAAQAEPEVAAETVPESADEFVESVETDVSEPTSVVEAEPEADPNKPLSPEDIAKFFAAQAEPEAVVDAVPETAEEVVKTVEQTNIPKPDVSPEVLNTSEDTVYGEDLPADPVSDTTDIKEKVNFISQLIGRLKNILPKKKTPSVEDNSSDAGAEETSRNDKTNIIVKLIAAVKNPLSKKQKPRVEDITSDSCAEKADKKEKTNIISKLIGAIKKPLSKKESKKTKAARSDENAAENSFESAAIKEAPKSEKPRKKSGLKSALAVIGVLLLMTGSFVAGFIARDHIALPGQDPAKLKAESEANAKKAQDEKKAKELAEISPKDYTSSMYLDSIILKGKAEKITTIKLKKIDNISKITEFPNLRKIKLDGMSGNEDLSLIQELKGLEEITIESSVIRNQFKNGSYGSVTYLEMYDCTVEDSSQFANFKGLAELYIYSTKFPSATGNLELTAYLPAAQSITLSNCGEYEELAGAKNLNHLKSLSLSSKTLIRNMSYTENPNIEKLKVDVSFAENTEQLQKLADLQNIKSITIQAKRDRFSSSQLSSVKKWITSLHPDATVEISTY